MSAETIATVDATAGAVAPFALDITKDFYGDMIASLPSVVLTVFNPAHNVPISTHQPEALAASVVAYASNIKDLSPLLVPGGAVDAINHRRMMGPRRRPFRRESSPTSAVAGPIDQTLLRKYLMHARHTCTPVLHVSAPTMGL